MYRPATLVPCVSPLQTGLWSIVYGSARRSVLKQLDPIHHLGLCITLGAFGTFISWMLSAPTVRLDLTKLKRKEKKDTTNPETYKQFYLQLIIEFDGFLFLLLLLFTDGSKKAHKHGYCSRGRSFVILSHSLSSLQAIFNLKYDHPILVQNII